MSWRNFARAHFEVLLVAAILIVVSAVFHWIPHKIAFLNFFYLPVFAAGYMLGARRALFTSILCVLAVVIYYFWAWTGGALRTGRGVAELLSVAGENWETVVSLTMWGGFLILTGAAFARAHERMVSAYSDIHQQAEELGELNQRLQASANDLKQQAEELQQKNLRIEQLRQQVEETLYSTMDSTVARLIIQGRLRQEKRNLTVVFCDLKGFSAYAHSFQPEVVLEDLNHFYGLMEELIETYHGHIDKYMGDGIMCEFGAPVDYEQHSLQAVVATLKMQEKSKELFEALRLPWQVRIGIASGESIVGLLGKQRRSYSAIGDVVNLAKRLEEIAEPGSVLIDESTYRAVRCPLEVRQFRGPGGRRVEDKQTLEAIAEKHQQLERHPDSPELLFEMGMLYYRIQEASRALGYLGQAMQLRPDDNAIKVAYADASIRRDEYEKIAIRGFKEKRAAFEVLGLANPLQDRDRFPKGFYDRYHHVQKLVEIPDSVTLPTEVIDAAVGHSLSVAVVAYGVADRMGLPEELKLDLLAAARLQDLGKSVVWHHITNRRGGLSDQERKDLEAHVPESVAMARRAGYNRPGVIEIIANHHEMLNGTGYPRHAKGEEIPLGARISCVADSYCALTAWRPYREAWDSRVALSEIRKGAVTGKYDPKVVDALCELMA